MMGTRRSSASGRGWPLAVLVCISACWSGCTQEKTHTAPAPADSDAAATSAAPAEPPAPLHGAGEAPRTWAEPFPGVRVDAARKVIEFDGQVPIDPHDPQTPRIYLEVMVCSRDTREHESLVVTSVKPSHIHAALLMIGLEPGTPGSWRWDAGAGRMIASGPTGPGLDVSFIVAGSDGLPAVHDPAAWVIDERETVRLSEKLRARDVHSPGWVFAGSKIALRPDGPGEYYKADIEGTLVGLATFGTETIALPLVISPEAAVEAPVWIADRSAVPPWGTRVTVRISAS